MQPAASTSLILTSCPSINLFSGSETTINQRPFLRHILTSHLAQAVRSQESLLTLTTALIHSAERAHILRDLNALDEISRVLMNLPIDAARQIGTYYYALVINRKGQTSQAQPLLEQIADNAPMTYRARAIQTLGGIQHDLGKLSEALRLQLEALRAASHANVNALQTTLMAHHEICVIKSLNGDHKGALSGLERLGPLVKLIAKHKPFYFYVYCNELAIELGESGRTAEAQAVCAIALASPFAKAYPEWSETRDEIAAKSDRATPSVVAITRALHADPTTQVQPQSEPELLKLIAFASPAIIQDSFQISVFLIPATATSASSAMSILDRVLICAGPRAPPTF